MLIGSAPGYVKRKPRKEHTVPTGKAFVWWCPHCDMFVVTCAEDHVAGTAKCDHCGASARINVETPEAHTPPSPKKRKPPAYEPRTVNVADV